jgi:hypothetical protein
MLDADDSIGVGATNAAISDKEVVRRVIEGETG